MSKVAKTIHKMKVNPRDWRIDHLEVIANHYQVNVRKSGGSHVVFDHSEWIELLCVPAYRPIKPIYVKRFIELIERLGGEL
jgi:hypothetical protein